MSRWMTPCRWAEARASATAATSRAAVRASSSPAQPVRQRRAADELLDQVADAVVGVPDLVQRHDPRVLELRGAAGLAEEPFGVLGGREAPGAGS